MNPKLILLITFLSCFFIGIGLANANCIPAWAGTVGAVMTPPKPNQVPPGYIIAVVGNGTSTLQVTYQPQVGAAVTMPIVTGDSRITIVGNWQGDGHLTAFDRPSAETFRLNSSIFRVYGATVNPTSGAIWSNINAGVGKVTGSGASLQFSGYTANGANQTSSLTFTGDSCLDPLPVATPVMQRTTFLGTAFLLACIGACVLIFKRKAV
jgi:hypothetical protein